MADISAFGLSARVIATKTFPFGFEVTQFADDTDPLDMPSLVIGENAMGLNGDLITWTSANPIGATIAVVPGSEDDDNLAILFEANRVGKGKRGAQDAIGMVITYPDGAVVALTGGQPVEYTPGKPVSSAGRLKSKTYVFAFENKTEVI